MVVEVLLVLSLVHACVAKRMCTEFGVWVIDFARHTGPDTVIIIARGMTIVI